MNFAIASPLRLHVSAAAAVTFTFPLMLLRHYAIVKRAAADVCYAADAIISRDVDVDALC